MLPRTPPILSAFCTGTILNSDKTYEAWGIIVFFSKNLRALAKMPVDYPYRKHTESLINERVAAMKESSTIEEAEKRIGMGQIEEVIIQAENELMLARNILEWKAWEPLSEQAPANQWKWPL